MKATEFCYWLQGFFEINGVPASGMTNAQTEMIRRHLHLVFKHEIDPSYPDKAALDVIHNGPHTLQDTAQPIPPVKWPTDGGMGDVQIRC